MVKFKCLCCDFEQEFEHPKEAFEAGWDIPPYFTVVQPLCNLCPAAPFVSDGRAGAQKRHAETHARWEREGRPEEFEMESELKLDGSDETPEQVVSEAKRIMTGIAAAIDDKGIPQVILHPEIEGDIENNPELKEFMGKFIVDAKNAMQAVKDGRHPDFGKAMEALGYAASKHLVGDDE